MVCGVRRKRAACARTAQAAGAVIGKGGYHDPKAMTEEERQTLIDLGYMDASTGLPDAQLRIPRFAPHPTPRQIK